MQISRQANFKNSPPEDESLSLFFNKNIIWRTSVLASTLRKTQFVSFSSISHLIRVEFLSNEK
jgi:hypothetical protein